MRLVYKFDIKHNDRLYDLCKTAKNLYNQTLYTAKTELRVNNKWLFYNDLAKIMKATTNLDGEINYRLLKAQVAQQCIKQVDKAIKSYVKSIKEWSKNKGKFKGKPNYPKYKSSKTNQLIYTNQCCQIKNGMLILEKDIKLQIPQWEKYGKALDRFQQVQVNPRPNGNITISIIYLTDDREIDNNKPRKYASIDLGVDNLVTMVIEDNTPLLFNGKQIKSLNQLFNKEYARLKSELREKPYTSRRISRLCVKRDNQLSDVFHKLSRYIVNLMLNKGITDIVVGYNEGWKDSINIGKRNNQTFVQIPYLKLLHNLEYKCKMCGIRIVVNEESYTSKCDALSLETICKQDIYLGKE